MLITVKRLEYTDDGVFGHLSIGDEFDCVTLERDDTLIPVGTYKVSMYNSPANKRVVPLLHVPNRSFIEIHIANWETQLKGCIAVGDKRQGNMVLNSKKTFEKLMSKIQHVPDLEIKIV